jgi:glucokinase
MKTFAIDIGGTKISVGAFDGRQMVLRESKPTKREGGPEWVCSQVAEVFEHWKESQGFRPDRAGIGFGGPVDFQTQTVTLSTHVEGWQGFPLLDKIEEITGVRPVMDNDANVGALGEYHFGAGQGADPLFYMTLSTGIGGGIVSHGSVYHGADSFAGELGHLTIRPGGPECLCGSFGCYERLCCGLWLERDYGRPAHQLLLDQEFVKSYVVNLALGLKSAIMILNPARIVIGGGISKAGDRLFVPLREELRRQITNWSRARIEVVPAGLGDNSVLYGAAVLAQGENNEIC